MQGSGLIGLWNKDPTDHPTNGFGGPNPNSIMAVQMDPLGRGCFKSRWASFTGLSWRVVRSFADQLNDLGFEF